MNKAMKFRRKLMWTWSAVAVVLLVAFYDAIRVAGEAIDQEQWVAHTQEVLKVIADARLMRARIANHLLAFQMNPENGTHSVPSDLQQLKEDLDSLRTLTADNPAQQKLLTARARFRWSCLLPPTRTATSSSAISSA